MTERVVTKEDIENLEPSRLFSAMIGTIGIQGAMQILHRYYEMQEFSEEDEEEQDCYDAIQDGIEAFAELIRRRLTQ